MNNDDPILRYYEAEMRYLRESGKEFARAHPDRARMLVRASDTLLLPGDRIDRDLKALSGSAIRISMSESDAVALWDFAYHTLRPRQNGIRSCGKGSLEQEPTAHGHH
ncbi:type VI secretion system baseplate subunit TssF [Paraburkholderia sp. EG286B]|uniref:type VI secretion system baseplate subunit TssF n=1 Tax=Paraburkholderia sp. EG286B TaxID=3237011 RepID=UPI0034D2ED96